MNNLSMENLQQMLQVGDTNASGVSGAGAASNIRVEREMQQQGMGLGGGGSVGDAGKTFSDVLRKSVENVNTMQVQADTSVKELIAGRNKNIHETMLAVERADTSLKLMMQVRNKILDAYREIMRMQV